jgi:molecular chaperone GrpE (heat shock protein)
MKMTKKDVEIARQAAWESYLPVLDDLERIAKHGPNYVDQYDEELVRTVFMTCVGEVLCRCNCVKDE